jgi:hypothetical protein
LKKEASVWLDKWFELKREGIKIKPQGVFMKMP